MKRNEEGFLYFDFFIQSGETVHKFFKFDFFIQNGETIHKLFFFFFFFSFCFFWGEVDLTDLVIG
jgi:hypothetical protein